MQIGDDEMGNVYVKTLSCLQCFYIKDALPLISIV